MCNLNSLICILKKISFGHFFFLCFIFKTGLIFILNFCKSNFVIHIMNFLVTYYNSVTKMSKIWGTLYINYSELACTVSSWMRNLLIVSTNPLMVTLLCSSLWCHLLCSTHSFVCLGRCAIEWMKSDAVQ